MVKYDTKEITDLLSDKGFEKYESIELKGLENRSVPTKMSVYALRSDIILYNVFLMHLDTKGEEISEIFYTDTNREVGWLNLYYPVRQKHDNTLMVKKGAILFSMYNFYVENFNGNEKEDMPKEVFNNVKNSIKESFGNDHKLSLGKTAVENIRKIDSKYKKMETIGLSYS